MIAARPAVDADQAVIAELRRIGSEETGEKRGGPMLLTEELSHDRDHHTIGPIDVTLVGTIDGHVVGVATVVRSGRRAVLSELFTHPRVRGVGVGHELLTSAIAQATTWGCSGMDSYALPGDRDTKNFFESHAMKSRLLVVHTPIERTSTDTAATPSEEIP